MYVHLATPRTGAGSFSITVQLRSADTNVDAGCTACTCAQPSAAWNDWPSVTATADTVSLPALAHAVQQLMLLMMVLLLLLLRLLLHQCLLLQVPLVLPPLPFLRPAPQRMLLLLL
jgi:hypothetical protein